MKVKVKNEDYSSDTQEDIDRCLQCRKPECTNCLCYGYTEKSRSEMFEERNEIIMEMFRFGIKGTEIAKSFGLDSSVIYKVIKRYGGKVK